MNVLTFPAEVAPDLSTRGTLLRYSRLRKHGFDPQQAEVLADSGYDVIGFAEIPVQRSAS